MHCERHFREDKTGAKVCGGSGGEAEISRELSVHPGVRLPGNGTGRADFWLTTERGTESSEAMEGIAAEVHHGATGKVSKLTLRAQFKDYVLPTA